MINFHQISSGGDAAKYHEKAFVADGNIKGADNYYVDKAATATWEGNGARILGLHGESVKKEDFVNLLEGRVLNPETGKEQDLKANGHADRRCGIDLTIAPSKSVSVLALIGGDERLIQAHETANRRAMTWIEEHASLIRVGKDGTPQQTGNLVWATIQHQTNRENEPHLHNHNVMMALTFDTENGKWRSLTNDEVLKIRTWADEVYKAELKQLVKEAGYQTRDTKDGFEIVGMSQEQIAVFSGRSKQIDDAIRSLGYDPEAASWAMRQAAALDTRAGKKEISEAELKGVWVRLSEVSGLDVKALTQEARANSADINPLGLGAESKRIAGLAVSQAIEDAATREQAFSVQQLEGRSAYFGNGNARIDDVKEAVQAHIEGKQLVVHEGSEGVGQWYTTQRAIYSENLLISTIHKAKGTGTPILSSEVRFETLLTDWQGQKTNEINADKPVDAWVKFQLSSEQLEAAKNILLHKDSIQGVQGDAGTGKTAGLEFAKYVADKEGWVSVGTATAASASSEIQSSTKIESMTMASYFAQKGNAERIIGQEIEGLREKLRQPMFDKGGRSTGIESKTLSVQSLNLNFGENKYFFDHDKGQIYKATGTFASQVGQYLIDQVEKHKEVDFTSAPSLGEKFKQALVERAEKLGHTLVSYSPVHVVEANAARNALYASNKAEAHAPLLEALQEKQAALNNLRVFGNEKGAKMLFVLDEASMTGIHDASKWLNDVANLRGARVVLQGDIAQHGSVVAGRFFAQAQAAGMNTAVLEETMRFKDADVRQKAAVVAIKGRGYAEAIMMLNPVQLPENQVREVPANRYVENFNSQREAGIQKPVIDVVVLTNADRKEINANVQKLLSDQDLIGKENKVKEHFDNSLLTEVELRFTKALAKDGVNRLVFGQRYQELGVKSGDVLVVTSYNIGANEIHGRIESTGREVTINPELKQVKYTAHRLEQREFSVGDKVETRMTIRPDGENAVKIKNGTRGYVVSVDDVKTTIEWADKKLSVLTNSQMRSVDHSYAHTSQKDQGATYAVEIWAVSQGGAKTMNSQAAYVSMTRAKVRTEIYTSDLKTMLLKAGIDVKKTTALLPADLGIKAQESETFKVRKLAEAQAILDSAEVSSSKGLSKTGSVEKTLEPTSVVAKDRAQSSEKGLAKGLDKAEVLSR